MIRMDEEIKKDIVDQFFWDDRIDASKVTVSVVNREVTLSGLVRSYFSKRVADEDARIVAGVKAVHNQVEVEYPFETTEVSDDVLLNRIKNKLLVNADINSRNINVEVEYGRVRLWGTVDALWKKYHVETIAATEPGVVHIENLVAVLSGKDVVDKEIARNISSALKRNTVVDEEDVEVEVSDRRVILNGEVRSWIAREEIYKTALYATGVESIHDNLSISDV